MPRALHWLLSAYFGGTVYCLVIRRSWREFQLTWGSQAAALTITLTAIACYRAQLCVATLMSSADNANLPISSRLRWSTEVLDGAEQEKIQPVDTCQWCLPECPEQCNKPWQLWPEDKVLGTVWGLLRCWVSSNFTKLRLPLCRWLLSAFIGDFWYWLISGEIHKCAYVWILLWNKCL